MQVKNSWRTVALVAGSLLAADRLLSRPRRPGREVARVAV
jgi:hypothetical protein